MSLLNCYLILFSEQKKGIFGEKILELISKMEV